MITVTTKIGDVLSAKHLVETFHYSKRYPTAVQFVVTWNALGGLFGCSGPCVAACVFRQPPARWREPVIELSRLVRHPDFDIPPLSRLVSDSLRLLRERTKYDLVVSYADPAHGHHGGIYQACSWNYHGMRDCRPIILVDGKPVHPRSLNSARNTSSPKKLAEILGVEITTQMLPRKHLYWKALRKEGERKAARLGLERNPYPKPTIACIGQTPCGR